MDLIDSLCRMATDEGASDIFFHSGVVPKARIHDQLVLLGEAPISEQELESFWTRLGVAADVRDADASFISPEGNRYRVNLFHSLTGRGAVLRPIKMVIPALASLAVPQELIKSWLTKHSGLILVTGPTDSGKSTTLASCLDWLNHHQELHIITIEDPIEYLFTPDRCLFTQREVGTDTVSFAEGLRRSLRQSPDVILLGEIRDTASALTALQAAETGHLVLATLHSSNVLDSMERLSRLFDITERSAVMQVLSQQLIGILSQKLVPALTEGRALIVEHFENQGAPRTWIQESKFRELSEFLSRGDNPANVSFLKSFITNVEKRRISVDTGMQSAPNPQEFKRMIRGVRTDSSARVS